MAATARVLAAPVRWVFFFLSTQTYRTLSLSTIARPICGAETVPGLQATCRSRCYILAHEAALASMIYIFCDSALHVALRTRICMQFA